ncbi:MULTISPECIES: hypothetical protein [Sphingobacterium]|uniref:hypothetical protein n=1 Tax=Sphingobacterium TaxID=28453 RepID=UPI00257EB7AF|nr:MULTISPECIES: hypothetical protein [Sphingobacterium]
MIDDRFKIITFYYPSKIIGGAELLFLRLAINLSRSAEIVVQYVDFPDGFVAKEIENNQYNISIIPFDFDRRIMLGEDSLLVAPLSSIFQVSRVFNKNVHVMLWSIHPMGLKDTIDSLPSYISSLPYHRYGVDLTKFIAKNGVFFMDRPNFNIQKEIFAIGQSQVDYLPIFSSVLGRHKQYGSNDSGELRLGWLGRLCIEKVNPLVNVIAHCNAYLLSNPKENIVFSIIGDGDKRFMIEDLELHPNLELKFLGTLSGERLHNLMIEDIDLMFAMGTSALEAGLLHIATVLVDLSFKDMAANNRFRFLYESEGYSVADEYDEENNYAHELDTILGRVKSGEISLDADKCYEYSLSHHSEESAVKKFCAVTSKIELQLSAVNQSHFGKYRQLFFLKSIYFKLRRWFGI